MKLFWDFQKIVFILENDELRGFNFAFDNWKKSDHETWISFSWLLFTIKMKLCNSNLILNEMETLFFISIIPVFLKVLKSPKIFQKFINISKIFQTLEKSYCSGQYLYEYGLMIYLIYLKIFNLILKFFRFENCGLSWKYVLRVYFK